MYMCVCNPSANDHLTCIRPCCDVAHFPRMMMMMMMMMTMMMTNIYIKPFAVSLYTYVTMTYYDTTTLYIIYHIDKSGSAPLKFSWVFAVSITSPLWVPARWPSPNMLRPSDLIGPCFFMLSQNLNVCSSNYFCCCGTNLHFCSQSLLLIIFDHQKPIFGASIIQLFCK